MTLLKILEYPNPRLKTVAKPVDNVLDTNVQQDLDDMLETLLHTPHCGGLAATQVDIQHPFRLFVFFDSDDQKTARHVINPEIIETSGEVFEEEGCMSVYPNHIHAAVTRPAQTKIKFIDRHGKPGELTRDGYLAKLYSSGIILRLFYLRLNGSFKRCLPAENLKYGRIFLRFPRSPSFNLENAVESYCVF